MKLKEKRIDLTIGWIAPAEIRQYYENISGLTSSFINSEVNRSEYKWFVSEGEKIVSGQMRELIEKIGKKRAGINYNKIETDKSRRGLQGKIYRINLFGLNEKSSQNLVIVVQAFSHLAIKTDLEIKSFNAW